MIARQIVIAIWFATFAPAETPKNIVDKLNSEMLKALNLPDIQAKLATIGAEPIGSRPEQLAAHELDCCSTTFGVY